MKQLNKYKILSFLILFFVTDLIIAQQDAQYTQYMYNMSVVNPAYAGSKEAVSIGFLGREQWAGVSGAPRTITGFIHSPIGNDLGLGMSIISDKVGPVSETSVYADLSYTINTSYENKLAFGLKAGFTFQNIGLLSLTKVNPTDPLFTENVNKTHPNIGAGLYYYSDEWYIGLSMPNIIKSRHFKRSNGIISKASENMHTFITGGYVFELSDDFKFKPSLLSKFAYHTPLSLDISANFLFRDKFEFGLSYRWDDSVSGLVNMLVTDSFRIGYAYDHTISNLGTFNSGSHELFLLYDFNFDTIRYKSPRFF